MIIAGLTGGMGSGKSSAARCFERSGIPVVDADTIGHELIAPGGSAETAVLEAFGPDILTDGAIDRQKLGARVFGEPDALRRLNDIVHPLLFQVIAERCTALAAAGHPVAIVDAALLGEGETLEPWLDCLVLVDCPLALRVKRLIEHRGMTEAQVHARIAAQSDPERKRSLARWVIDNGGSLSDLELRVDAVAASLLSYARSA